MHDASSLTYDVLDALHDDHLLLLLDYNVPTADAHAFKGWVGGKKKMMSLRGVIGVVVISLCRGVRVIYTSTSFDRD